MPVVSPPQDATTRVPAKTDSDFSANNEKFSAPVVEKFFQRYESFKANKAPAIDMDEIGNVFRYFDENHDGLISKDDLRHFMGRLGFQTTEEEIASMVSSVDINGDGSVDFTEFAYLYQTFTNNEVQKGDNGEEDDLKEAFEVFDKNDDGLISPCELQEVLVNLGIDEAQSLSNCEKMIQSVDSDGNGGVDFHEFKKMMHGDFGRG